LSQIGKSERSAGMKKKALWLIFIFFIGMLLSSCSMLNNISTKVIGKDSDIKLNSGIINGNLEQVKEAIEDGANINKMDIPLASEKNPVILAMTKNQDRIAEYLINNGIDENYVDTQDAHY
jgi:ankyrin repeat protein